MLLFRFVKHMWSAPIHLAGTDIELERAVPRTFMCLLNFSTEARARRASGFLKLCFLSVDLDGLANGRWNVECKRAMKPTLRSFLLLRAAAKVGALSGGGEVVFIGAQTP
jgi:hypothetical protein